MADPSNPTTKNPWWWIPTLYYTQGIPYIIVVTVSIIMYKDLGISNARLALFTSLLALPWALKPLWSPFVDVFKTKRWWTYMMQGVIGIGFIGAAIAMQTPYYFEVSLFFLFLVAFASSTHDIAADGFYMLALSDDQQSYFVGIRSTFFRLAMWSGEGLLVVLAGVLAIRTMDSGFAWTVILGMVAGIMILMFGYHQRMLPYPLEDAPAAKANESPLQAVWSTIAEFLKKDQILLAVTFVLLYRFGEGQLIKMAAPFLMDSVEAGGLGLSVTDVGYINGVIGLLSLTTGGIIGGIVISRHGLKAWMWPMIGIMNLPNLAYWYLAANQPENFWIISSLVGIEKFGYGFGFTAFLMFLIYIARGPFKTAHYAFGTALMAFGMSIPGAISGLVQEAIGYEYFFIWVLVSAIPIVIITPFIRIEADFGKKKDD